MREKHYWAWPIAGYFTLGGLGAGMLATIAVFDLVFHIGRPLALATFVAVVPLALGSSLLIFELGRPFQFWRVFSTQRAVLTVGAWMVSALMFVGLVYFSCWTGWFPWSDSGALRAVVAVFALALGVGVLLYPGIELSSFRARPFWNTPALPVLFAASGLLTGIAGNVILVGLWPFSGSAAAADVTRNRLHSAAVTVAVAEMLVLALFVVLSYTSGNVVARRAAAKWLSGPFATAFWGALVAAGLVAPVVLYAVGGLAASIVASLLVLVGGVTLRFLVVYSDERLLLTGEQRYWERLPRGDEAFLRAWK